MKILHLLYSGLGGHGNVFFSLVKADKDKLFQQEALFAGVEELRPAYQQQCAEHSIVYNYLKKKPGFDIGFYTLCFWLVDAPFAQVVWTKSAE